jgi:divalent metal cation (Fe/Co/Zn/Cd) transporter
VSTLADPRQAALRRAARLCGATVLWNLTVGTAAVATAVVAHSLSLIGFGVNAVVDSSVSALLVWRFADEAAGRSRRAEEVEHVALRVAGAAFSIIAVYLFVQGVRSLVLMKHPEDSLFGIVEGLAALAVLPLLAISKYRLSRRLHSSALRADSLLSASGVVLAAAALASLLLYRALGWWWADAVAAILIAAVLAPQGVRSLRGQS